MELVSNCCLLEGQETPPRQSSISYKDSKIQSSYNGSGRQGTDSLKGSETQALCSLPAPTLKAMLTKIIVKFNTNS